MKAGLSNGRWMWSAPVGYRKPPDPRSVPSLVPDPEPAALVRRAFELASSGTLTTHEIWEEMTALGLKTNRGKRMSEQSSRRSFSIPSTRAGSSFPNGISKVRGISSPSWSLRLFDAVQKARKRSQQKDGRHLDHPDFPLRRVVVCGTCNTPITGSWSKGRSGRYAYYHCPAKGCGGTNVRKEKLEGLFTSWLEANSIRAEAFVLLEAVVRDVWTEHADTATRDLAALERRRASIEGDIDNLVQSFAVKNAIRQADYDRQRERLDEDLGDVLHQIEVHRGAGSDLDRALAFAKDLLVETYPNVGTGCSGSIDQGFYEHCSLLASSTPTRLLEPWKLPGC